MAYFREIYPKLISEKDNNKIIILLGARQVGKTTLLKMLIAEERPSKGNPKRGNNIVLGFGFSWKL